MSIRKIKQKGFEIKPHPTINDLFQCYLGAKSWISDEAELLTIRHKITKTLEELWIARSRKPECLD